MSKKEQILQEAEKGVRAGGYNNVSFRDLADAVGIKSASVHYHFPTKIDLGVALAERYTDNFMLALGEPQDYQQSGEEPFTAYVALFTHALKIDKKMCLCGLLGAELDGLPEEVKKATKGFFERNLAWLSKAYKLKNGSDEEQALTASIKLISMLEGALLVSRTLNDPSVFDRALEGML